MTAVTIPKPAVEAGVRASRRARRPRAFVTLARRRLSLSAHTPREILVPLLTPVMFSTIIAPALAKNSGNPHGLDYQSFVALGTVGLLVPISCMFAGIGVIVDRESGAQRDLLAAPIPRGLMVLGNLAVALIVSVLQLGALIVAATLRGADFTTTLTGALWFGAAALALAVTMYGAAEILANKVGKQEEYIGAVPAIAIVPWFVAGSLFPISALPSVLGAVAKALPLTHALALIRYGLLDRHGSGLHDIWGMHNATVMASLSLAVVVAYAITFTVVAVRVFNRSAVS